MALRNLSSLVAVTILCLSLASFPLILARSIPSLNSIHEQDIWKDSDKFTTYEAGKTYKDLSNVKRYFHELGYNISSTTPSNFDDKYDQDMVSAIKTYQKNHNLNPTGKLDHNTLQRLKTRGGCGVHTVSHYKFFNRGQRWPVGTTVLPYIYDPHPLFDASFKNAVARAFDTWSRVMGFTFYETFRYNEAKITIQFASGAEFKKIDPNRITWAYAFAPTDGRFFLNENVTWVSSGDFRYVRNPIAVDVETVALHEAGHLMGLDHSQFSNAVMYADIYPHSRKVNLAADDIYGIKTLYNLP